MAFTRRSTLGTALAVAGGLGLRSQASLAQAKPFEGKEIKVLVVRSSQFQAQAKRVAAFSERTGIKVTFVEVPFPAMREKLTAELVGGSSDYDVFCPMDAWVPSLVGMLDPIEPRLAARNIDLARYPSAFVNAGTVEGKIYGVPVRGSVQMLFYRRDLFEKNGLQLPRTWDEVAQAGHVLQEKESIAGVAMYYGRNNGQNLMQWYDFLWTNGADFLGAKSQPVFNSEAGLAATQRYLDLMLKDKVTPVGAASFDEQAATNSFVQGRSAMVPVWNWVMVRFKDPSSALKLEQVGFTPLPTVRPGVAPTSYTNTWIYALNAKGANKDAAMEFVTWACSPELERDILLDPRENEVIAVQWANLRDGEVNARWSNLQMIGAKALEHPHLIPQFAQMPQVIDAVETAMNNAAIGAATVPDAMNGAARQVSRIVGRIH